MKVAGGDSERIARLDAELSQLAAERDALEARWQQEREQVDAIIALRAQLCAASEEEVATLQQALAEKQQALSELQGETPLLFAAVDGNVVAAVVSDWTGIPLGRMVKNEIEAVLTRPTRLINALSDSATALS